jgi:LacI family transcriptional regulator
MLRRDMVTRTSSAAAADALPLVYQQIKSRLLEHLGERWPKGSRLPPVPELAAELGTGKSNTHRALKELVREGILVARPGRGTFVCSDSPSPKSRKRAAPLQGRRVTIVRGTADAFVFPAVDAMSEELSQLGCVISYEDYFPIDHAKQRPDADAVVLVNPNNLPVMQLNPRQPVVIVSTALEIPVPMDAVGYDVVLADSEQGGYLAGEYLRKIGCESAYFIGVYPKRIAKQVDVTSAARLRGFEAGYEKRLPESHKYRGNHYQTSQGARAVRKYIELDPRPRGVFAASDEIALGFIYGMLSQGMEPGRDYQLVGFDGQIRCREGTGFPLTTVEVPMHQMGKMGARMLAERLENPQLPVRRVMVGSQMFEGVTAVATSTSVQSSR